MKRVIKFFLFFFIPIICFPSGKGGNEKVVLANKIKDLNINLDGKLTEPIWQSNPITEFTQKDPNEGTPVSEKTEAWIVYDENYIYIAARLSDSKPETIDASLARRDNYFLSDWFAFYVDPYNDKKTGYFFAVNAGGSVVDGVLYNDSWDDDS